MSSQIALALAHPLAQRLHWSCLCSCIYLHLHLFACSTDSQHSRAACTGGTAPLPLALPLISCGVKHCSLHCMHSSPARGGCSAALAFADLACAANAVAYAHEHCTARGVRMQQERSSSSLAIVGQPVRSACYPTYQTPSKGYVLFKGYCQCSCQPQLEPSSSSFTCTSPSIGFLCSA